MNAAPATHANHERLVQMLEDICHFFQSEADHEVAVSSVAKHLHSFWVPRMRQQIIAHLHAGGEGMSTLARAAVWRLERETGQTSA